MQKAILTFWLGTLVDLCFHQSWQSAVAFASTAALMGLTLHLDKRADIDDTNVQAQIKDLKGKLDAILIGRGIGR